MSTIDQTLKLALDALINAVPCTSEQVKEQADSVAALRAALSQVGQDAQDAARYRWLKLGAAPCQPGELWNQLRAARQLVAAHEVFTSSWTRWDSSIDAAIQSKDRND